MYLAGTCTQVLEVGNGIPAPRSHAPTFPSLILFYHSLLTTHCHYYATREYIILNNKQYRTLVALQHYKLRYRIGLYHHHHHLLLLLLISTSTTAHKPNLPAMTTTTYKQLPTNFSRQPSTASLLPLGNNYNHPATTTASATTQQQRKTVGGLKPSRSIRVKAAVKAIVSPVKTRKEKKAAKMEIREREEARRVANIDDFLLRGRIYYEKQLQNQMNYDPFADHLAMEKCQT